VDSPANTRQLSSGPVDLNLKADVRDWPNRRVISSNVNVIVASSAGEPTGHAFAQSSVTEAKIEFAELGAQQVKASIVHTRLGVVAEVTYILNIKNSAPLFGSQLYLLHTSHIDIVTATTAKAADSRSNLQLVIESWQWK
jgi:hypothetical protein